MTVGTTNYRVGIIGTGRIASTIQDETAHSPGLRLLPFSHAGAYATVPQTRIIAAADTSPDRLAAFAERWGVATTSTYADYRKMLQSEPLDIVSVCTPTRSHTQIALEVAASGVKGVFLEKPITQSLAEADQMIAAFDQQNIKVAVNHTRTYDPFYRRVRELIADGTIGPLRTILVHWHEGFLFGGTHLFDLLRFLTGSEAASVSGHLDPGDGRFDQGGSGLVCFRDGTDVLINCRLDHAAPLEVDIVGTKGRIRIGSLVYPELYVWTGEGAGREYVQRGFPGAVVARSPMTTAVEELLQAMATGEKPASDLQDARADLELAVAFHLADRTGRSVELPVQDHDFVIEDPWGRS